MEIAKSAKSQKSEKKSPKTIPIETSLYKSLEQKKKLQLEKTESPYQQCLTCFSIKDYSTQFHSSTIKNSKKNFSFLQKKNYNIFLHPTRHSSLEIQHRTKYVGSGMFLLNHVRQKHQNKNNDDRLLFAEREFRTWSDNFQWKQINQNNEQIETPLLSSNKTNKNEKFNFKILRIVTTKKSYLQDSEVKEVDEEEEEKVTSKPLNKNTFKKKIDYESMEQRIYDFLEKQGVIMEINPDDAINQMIKYNCNKKLQQNNLALRRPSTLLERRNALKLQQLTIISSVDDLTEVIQYQN